MKVFLYFNGRARLGGVERRLARVMNEIVSGYGWDVRIILKLYDSYEEVAGAYNRVVTNNRIEMVGLSSFGEIMRYVMAEKPDWVIYTGGYGTMMPFMLAGIVAGAKRLLLSVTTNTSMLDFTSLREELLFNATCNLSTKIDCLYPEAIPGLTKRYPNREITATPCPSTELDVFSPGTKANVITYVARWVPGKNPYLFIDAIALARESIEKSGYSVIMGGNAKSDVETERIKAYISEKGLDGIIETPGYIDAGTYLPAASVFLSLQDTTNYPSQSLLEAIACGCYIIATGFGDTGLLVHSPFGMLCGKEVPAIADALVDYIGLSPDDKQKCVAAAREYAMKTFRLEDSVSYYHDLLLSPEK